MALSLSLTSCNDWLDLRPNNEQVTDDYWQSKEDVEAVVASGYYYMRTAVPYVLSWGELRGGNFYNLGTAFAASKMQDFDMQQNNEMCDYSKLYQVISMANSVLDYAPDVQGIDDTYYNAMMQSHLCEAYFQRAWAYSILVKNWKEVPLITSAYVNDDAELSVPKASESEIIAQIKADCMAALATGAAKATYEEDWQTKSRATKWALYAVMADICLWNHEYDECVKYADLILNASDALRPAFISETSKWFEIFCPGLSNESIFELYWSYADEATNNNFASRFPVAGTITGSSTGNFNFTQAATDDMIEETTNVVVNTGVASGRIGRMYLASYYGSTSAPALWKYRGTEVEDVATVRTSTNNDANFILYRVADVMLMKAEALVMKGQSSWAEAVGLINQIRKRAGLAELASTDDDIAAMDQVSLLTEVMHQRSMEFLGEAHRWYDLLRLARYDKKFAPSGTVEDAEGLAYEAYKSNFGEDDAQYKSMAMSIIIEANETTSDDQLKSVLQNSWAWYLPLPESDINSSNNVLVQNPYYKNY
ncbi:MAG: RagB/SusD family nutrient uptake outer membrane protein [Bacteroidales bacterium]|nr:RagB/SusD family nutrient uptake outer membrane protein [Bacteroidales bacterium]